MKCVFKQNFKIVLVQNNSCETYSSLNTYDNSYPICKNAEIITVELTLQKNIMFHHHLDSYI